MGIKKELKNYDLRPSKRLGQHFLIDRGALNRIIQAAELKKDDIILEIGPGTGILTKELAKTAKKVVAVEKDIQLYEFLKEALKNYKNVEIIHGDILKIFNFQFSIFNQFSISNYKVVANIPYYITSPLIRKFLEAKNQPELMVLMVQKEVAQRICASPPDMNLLAVSVQFYAQPKIIGYVSKNSFWPKPKVDSAILRIAPLINADNKQINADIFFKIVKTGFFHPRKQLINNLVQLFNDHEKVVPREKIINWLMENNIKPEKRPENLSLEDWEKLAKTIS